MKVFAGRSSEVNDVEKLGLDENPMGHLPISRPVTAVNNLLTGNGWSKSVIMEALYYSMGCLRGPQ